MVRARLTGKKYGHLRVLQLTVARTKSGDRKWRCICEAEGCGRRVTVAEARLLHRQMAKTHCGCQRKTLKTKYPTEAHTLYDMIRRCHDPEHHGYKTYGAKGVSVCDRWKDKEDGLKNFLEDMGPRPKGNYSIDREDPTGPYHPDNCSWATSKEQGRNKRNTKMLPHPVSGELVPAAALAEELGVTYQRVRADYIKKGLWP